MNTNLHSRSRSFVAGLAALAITTAVVSSLVESFDPVQLQRIEQDSAIDRTAYLDTRKTAELVRVA